MSLPRNQSAPANGRGGDTHQGMGLAPEICDRMGVRTGVIRIRPRLPRASPDYASTVNKQLKTVPNFESIHFNFQTSARPAI